MNRWQRISLLNTQPLNKAAERLLPPDWTNPGWLHVLSLAFWGTQHGIYPQLDYQVVLLTDWEPDGAMAWVTQCPDAEGELLAPDGLDNVNASRAAELVLENIWYRSR